MEPKDIRPFIPVKDFEKSKSFYKALGFTSDDITNEMTIMSNGACTFFLYKIDDTGQENSLVFQLIVPCIENAFSCIKSIEGFNIKYEPIKEERWGKVIYMWGPSGEMWHITELHS